MALVCVYVRKANYFQNGKIVLLNVVCMCLARIWLAEFDNTSWDAGLFDNLSLSFSLFAQLETDKRLMMIIMVDPLLSLEN